ncbi:MAG: lmo0937 family membrane protein [Gemmatimonadales bacterium]
MLAALAVILIVAWLLGYVVFNVAGGLIHILLVAAVIFFIWQLVAGRRSRTPTV